MTILEICNLINAMFNKIIPPFPQISRLMLVCSMIRRPGLSVIKSVANITKDLNKLGIPTGPMPDGSDNLTIAFAYANTKEVYRALKKDASVQVGIQPGSMMLTAFGANAGGPITVQGINMSAGQAFGDIN